ncbi:hypothetical protein P0Y67_15595 [Photobacterium sp. SP02]|uniref:Phage shock protein B n=1 Tax=Photobacterium arenosum TaxID=2774143 RepID=A0ABR9BMB3_9GAMM|nr:MULTISPECIES: hypothetical protein [Photobacterium]MBD8513627.1 hypothetical protein [Photobacterium arenosum]MBV7264402.1 hypothetical protein [Photobacterium sp. WH24]MDO6583673.1 hypothetical protein [Photobacterium sp. 2_MG-2023]
MTAVWIIAIIFGALIVQQYLRLQAKQKDRDRLASQEAEALRAEMTELRERLSVLEKIVTDKGYQIKEDIEKLP